MSADRDGAPSVQLKDMIDRACVARVAAMVGGAWAGFDARGFTRAANRGLDALELMHRGRHIAAALRAHLPPAWPEARAILHASLGPTLDEGGGGGAWVYLPHALLVAREGPDDFDASMAFLHALTQRFTGEFSLGRFVERDPARALGHLRAWATDPSVHVRRLVSEGTRPRLPWAPRLRTFAADPSPVLPLLEALRDDPEDYVRRSVANHLNDLSKDHAPLVTALCARWMLDAPGPRAALVKHALRTLSKRGDPAALAVLGSAEAPTVTVAARGIPRALAIGDKLRLALTVTNTGPKPQKLLLDLAVSFVKSDGSARPKVFRLATATVAPGAAATVAKTVTFAQLSTRRVFPGAHAVEARVNGVGFPLGSVRVTAPSPPR